MKLTTLRCAGLLLGLTVVVACGTKKQSGGGDDGEDGDSGSSSEGGSSSSDGPMGGSGKANSAGKSGSTSTGGTSSNAGQGGNGQGAGGSSPQGTGGAAPANCTALTVTGFKAVGTPGWLEASGTAKGDTTPYTVRIELNEDKGFKQAAGTFDLSKEPDYGSANHAVIVFTGGDDVDEATEVFFQTAGSMVVTTVSSPVSAESKGSLSGVTLTQSTIDDTTFDSVPVSGGDCLYIASTTWDSTVAMGTKCNVAEDCGDTSSKICDESTGTCVASQCDGLTVMCPMSGVCIIQSADGSAGACYAGCTPFGQAGCGGSTECVNELFDESQGICKKRGTNTEGMACTISDVVTDCVAGLVCSLEESGNICRAQCDYWMTPACSTGQHCELGSVCSDSPVDPAAIDGMCDGSSPDGESCGFDGTQVHAICLAETQSGDNVVMCRKTCRMSVSTDCTGGEVCNPYYDSVGVCQPPM